VVAAADPQESAGSSESAFRRAALIVAPAPLNPIASAVTATDAVALRGRAKESYDILLRWRDSND
jgi:hypothetical protein